MEVRWPVRPGSSVAGNSSLPDNEVWSRPDRVLQMKSKEKVEGKPKPLNASVVSRMVCFLFYSVFLSPSLFCFFYFESPVRRGLMLISPGRTFRRAIGRGLIGRLEGGGGCQEEEESRGGSAEA